MSESAAQPAAPEPVVVAPQAVTDAPAPSGPALTPLHGQLSRSASAMGNRAFTSWARGAGAAGEPLPTSSARDLWGSYLARDPAPAAAPAGEQTEDEAEEPIEVKALKFGKDSLDGVIPAAGGDLSKTFSTHLGKSAKFGPYSLQVPLFPLVTAGFGAGGAMSAKADASLKLAGTNIASAAMGQAKKQQITASGKGDASGTIAASLVAGIKFGVAGLANVGIYGQGTLAFNAVGKASFDGSMTRLKPKKGGGPWGPWKGDINFKAQIKGSLIAEAAGYFEYQVLWIFRDQFGKFKIGKWTLADAGLDLTGTLGPGKPLDVTVKPWVNSLMQPSVTQEIRARTQSERETAEKLAQAGAAGSPVARKLLRAPDPPPDEQPPAGGGAPPPAGGTQAAPPAAAPAGGEAAPAAGGEAAQPDGPEAAPAAAPAAEATPAPAAANNAQLAAIAGVTPGAAPTPGGGPGSFTLEAEPKLEE